MGDDFIRRSQNGQLGGVCAGIAEYFDWDVNAVRLAFIVSVVIGFPTFLLYIFAMWIVPKAPLERLSKSDSVRGEPVKQPGPTPAQVVWDTEQVELRYRQQMVPYTIPWMHVLWVFLAPLALLFTGSIGWGFSDAVWQGSELLQHMPVVEVLAKVATDFLDPAYWGGVVGMGTTWVKISGFSAAVAAMFKVEHKLVCTQSELVVERPLLADQRYNLSEVSMVEQGHQKLEILLESGRLIEVPLTGGEELTGFVAQLNRGRQHALGHREDLERAADQHAQLRRVMATEGAGQQ